MTLPTCGATASRTIRPNALGIRSSKKGLWDHTSLVVYDHLGQREGRLNTHGQLGIVKADRECGEVGSQDLLNAHVRWNLNYKTAMIRTS